MSYSLITFVVDFLTYEYGIYKEICHQANLVRPVDRYSGDELDEQDILHHGGGIAVLFRESPAEP